MGRADTWLAYVLAREMRSIADEGVSFFRETEESPRGAAVPVETTLRAVLRALMCAGADAAAAGWRADPQGAYIAERIGMESVRVRLHAESTDAAWREVLAVTPLALDVLMVLASRFRAGGGEVLLMRCGEILDAKGCRRWGEERQSLERQVSRELKRLGQISVGVGELVPFAVTAVDDAESNFVVALDPALKALWAAAPSAYVSERLLQFDHRLNRGADLLAQRMGLYFSLAGASSRPVVRSVRSVLRGVGLSAELSASRRGGRLADRFEEAMLRLEERKLFAIGYRRTRESGILEDRVKGWVKHWLEAEVVAGPYG